MCTLERLLYWENRSCNGAAEHIRRAAKCSRLTHLFHPAERRKHKRNEMNLTSVFWVTRVAALHSSKCLLWILKNYIRNNILKWNDSCNANPPETCYFKCQIRNSHLLFSVYIHGLASSWGCFRQIITKERGRKQTRISCFGFAPFFCPSTRGLLLCWSIPGFLSGIKSLAYRDSLQSLLDPSVLQWNVCSCLSPERSLSPWQLIWRQPSIALIGLPFMPWHLSFICSWPAGYANDQGTENHNPSTVMASTSMSLCLEQATLSVARKR